MKVLFTNSLTFGAYSNIKRLRRSHTFYVMDACAFKITSLDFHVTNLLNSYAPAYETDQYIDQLILYISRYKIDLLVPLGEEHKYIAMFRGKIVAASLHPCQIICPKDFACFDMFDDKILFQRFINDLAIPSICVPQITPIQELAAETKYIVKTRLGKAGFNTYQIDYGRVIKQQDIGPSSFIQEFIEGGRELCVAGISYKGQTEFIVYRSEIGVNYRLTRDRDSESALKAAIPMILEKSGYEGYFGFDFIEKDGSYFFLECNTRTTLGSIALTLDFVGERLVLGTNEFDHLVAPMLGVYTGSVLKPLLSLTQGFKLFDFHYSFLFPICFSLYYKFASPGLSKVLSFGFVRSRHHYAYYADAIPLDILERLEPSERLKYAGAKASVGSEHAVYILSNGTILRFVKLAKDKKHRPAKKYFQGSSHLETSLASLRPKILSSEDIAHIKYILSEKHPHAEWFFDKGNGPFDS